MYLVKIKIKRTGEKPITEQYLVEAVSLTDVDVKVTREFEGVDVEITYCASIKFEAIFETGEEVFFEFKNEIETIDDKKVTELYLQEAEDEPSARAKFLSNVPEATIIGANKKLYKGIIR